MLGIRRYNGVAIDLYQGDITKFACDAIVNAANTSLLGGSGVDGAIHRAGGPSILQECRKIGRCEVGKAVVTGAGKLPAKHIIHTVGPVWNGGDRGEPALLESCYERSLAEAERLGDRHVAFPAISTGAYGYPVDAAAKTALGAVKRFLDGNRPAGAVGRVTFVLFSAEHYQVFQDTLFATFPEERE